MIKVESRYHDRKREECNLILVEIFMERGEQLLKFLESFKQDSSKPSLKYRQNCLVKVLTTIDRFQQLEPIKPQKREAQIIISMAKSRGAHL